MKQLAGVVLEFLKCFSKPGAHRKKAIYISVISLHLLANADTDPYTEHLANRKVMYSSD